MIFRSMYKGGCYAKYGIVLLLRVLHTPCNVLLIIIITSLLMIIIDYVNKAAPLAGCTFLPPLEIYTNKSSFDVS